MIIVSNVKLEVFAPVDTDTMVSCDMMCYIPVHKYKHPGETRNFFLKGKRLNTKATGSFRNFGVYLLGVINYATLILNLGEISHNFFW